MPDIKEKLTFGQRRQIYLRYKKLLQLSQSFLKEEDSKIIRQALDEAILYYKNEQLPSGEPYILHLLDVARIVVEEIGMATKSVLASLLYDLVRREKMSLNELDKKYGRKVRELVEGLLKIFDVKDESTSYQPENFRRLLLTLSDDIRVILIRLAILLDEMRRMNYMPEEYRVKTAMQTFTLYAPLAHRLGLYTIKSELEDLSMKYTESEAYRNIIKKLQNTTAKRNRFIKKFSDPIRKELDKNGFTYEIKGRTKSIHSIWRKMKSQNVPFEQIYDIFAIRIILDSPPETEKSDCWRVYSIVSDFYRPNPERLRDWISIPKSNGYESLHTTVIGPEGKWVEVQIRSRRMDEIAEKGYAAHWKYKGIKGDYAFDNWMGKIRDILEASDASASEIVDNFRMNMLTREIFVFTPKGELMKLPEGASVLDFAFDIHSELGAQCVGGVVNNKNVSIRHKLKNGDSVEILTSRKQKPKNDWLSMVVTTKARSKIRQALKEELRQEADHGKELIKRRFKNWKIPFTQDNLNKLIKHYNIKEATKFFASVATGKIDVTDLKDILTEKPEEEPRQEKEPQEKELPKDAPRQEKETSDYIVIGDGLQGVDYKLAKCCNPIYGDDIIGFVTKTEGIKIHRANCINARRLIAKYDYRVISAHWKKTRATTSFQTRIKISGIDEIGMVNRISDIISNNMKVKMRSISIDSDNGLFEGYINLYVASTKNLEALITKLKKEKGILKVTRTDMKG
ncbi:MAG TPA: RelA/SpoT family protein [Bacteroidales bacterium]|nr:RelA/SpoT family protein [Bacteroidales bacterium]